MTPRQMSPTMPAAEYDQFDAMCDHVEEFEPLPTVTTAPVAEPETDEEETAPIDALILAALVSP